MRRKQGQKPRSERRLTHRTGREIDRQAGQFRLARELIEAEAGTLVVFHGLLPHWSAPNRSARSRHAYTLHATDGRAAYAPHNWLQRTRLPLRGFVD